MGSSRDENNAPTLGEALEFLSGMWSLDHALNARSKSMHKRAGITGPQRLALRIVGLFPGITFGHLAKKLHVHPSTLSGVIKRLEVQGLIVRSQDPEDARRGLLHLTPAGIDRTTPMEGSVEAAVSEVLARATKMQIQSARELFTALTESLAVTEPPSKQHIKL